MQNILTIDGDAITVTPSEEHVFLLDTKLVAQGFGVEPNVIRNHKQRNALELVEGKHWITVENTGVTKCDADSESTTYGNPVKRFGNPTITLWTKRGVVRLGFFICSDRARRFRDMAEDWVLERLENAAPVAGAGEVISRQILEGMCKLLEQHAQILQVMADHAANQSDIAELVARIVPSLRKKQAGPRPQPRIYAAENNRVCRLLDALIDAHACEGSSNTADFRSADIYQMAVQLGEFNHLIGDPPDEHQRKNKLMVNLRKFFNQLLIGERHAYQLRYARKARHRYYTATRTERMRCLQPVDTNAAAV